MPDLYAQTTLALPLTAAERKRSRQATGDEAVPEAPYLARGAKLTADQRKRLEQPIIANGEELDSTHLDALIENGAIADTPPEPREPHPAPEAPGVAVESGEGGEVTERSG